MLRSCYRTIMHFPGVGDVWVRWYWCAPGVKPDPNPSVFCSRNWRKRQGWPTGIPGEVFGAPRPWSNGRRKGKCKGAKGTPDAWLGLTSTPIVCEPVGLWKGGIKLGGSWRVTWTAPFEAQGGGEGNGQGSFVGTAYVASGGGESNGRSRWGSGWTAHGGAESDGLGYWSAGGWPGSGGGESDGSGNWRQPWTARGGAESNGAGVWPASGFLAAGGSQGNGQPVWGCGWPATGGGEGDGEATFPLSGFVADPGSESNGAGEWTSTPLPGGTCDDAPTVTLPYSGSFTNSLTEHQWWKFAVTTGQEYFIQVDYVSGNVFMSVDVGHGHCFDDVGLGAVTVGDCRSFTAEADELFLIHIFPAFAATTTYTISFGTGPCP